MAAEASGLHWSMLVDTRRCIACQACTMETPPLRGNFEIRSVTSDPDDRAQRFSC
jgi:Fe-S-cluster-containing dehydrogenase component